MIIVQRVIVLYFCVNKIKWHHKTHQSIKQRENVGYIYIYIKNCCCSLPTCISVKYTFSIETMRSGQDPLTGDKGTSAEKYDP